MLDGCIRANWFRPEEGGAVGRARTGARGACVRTPALACPALYLWTSPLKNPHGLPAAPRKNPTTFKARCDLALHHVPHLFPDPRAGPKPSLLSARPFLRPLPLFWVVNAPQLQPFLRILTCLRRASVLGFSEKQIICIICIYTLSRERF